MRWLLLSLLGIAVAYVVHFCFWGLVFLGVFETVYNQAPGPCRVIQVNGSEDILLLPNEQALISSGLHNVKPSDIVQSVRVRDGNILVFDFNKPENDVTELQILPSPGFDQNAFSPHGMSFWQDPNDGRTFLYVVNHLCDGDAIEVFEYLPDDGALKHLKQIQHPLINSPNDVEAVGHDMFYVTNTHYFNSAFMRQVENALRLQIATVVFHDGTKNETRLVAGSLKFPNGVSVSPDQRYVYVVAGNELQLKMYERNKTDNSLELVQAIQIGHSCDNMFIQQNSGDIWLGCHPRIIDIAVHVHNDVNHKTGSQVLRVKLGLETVTEQGPRFPDYEIDQVYINDGRDLKGSTVAVFYRGKMLVGTVLDNLLYCEVRSLED